jgi:hypothetical protein
MCLSTTHSCRSSNVETLALHKRYFFTKTLLADVLDHSSSQFLGGLLAFFGLECSGEWRGTKGRRERRAEGEGGFDTFLNECRSNGFPSIKSP